jgi:hypothetical protein
MLVIFWDLLLLRRGGEWGCGAFLLDWSQALIGLCIHWKGMKEIANNNSTKLIKVSSQLGVY